MMNTCLIAPHNMLHCFVGSEIDRMGRTYPDISDYRLLATQMYIPAPTTTLDIPLHKLRNPSPVAIR